MIINNNKKNQTTCQPDSTEKDVTGVGLQKRNSGLPQNKNQAKSRICLSWLVTPKLSKKICSYLPWVFCFSTLNRQCAFLGFKGSTFYTLDFCKTADSAFSLN